MKIAYSKIREIQTQLSHNLRDAQAAHKKAADRFRPDSSPNNPKFKVGDSVWLLRRNVKTTRPCDKLHYQRLGPFVIVDQINDVTFRLDLPSHMRNLGYLALSQGGLFHPHLH